MVVPQVLREAGREERGGAQGKQTLCLGVRQH